MVDAGLSVWAFSDLLKRIVALADRLSGPDQPAGADTGEHLLEHQPRQRITIREMRVGLQRDLPAAVLRAGSGTLDPTRRPPSVTSPASWP